MKNIGHCLCNDLSHLIKLILYYVSRSRISAQEHEINRDKCLVNAVQRQQRCFFHRHSCLAASQLLPSCLSWDESHTYVPPQTGPLTLPGQLKSHLSENEWAGTTIARQKQSIFYPAVGDSASVLSLSRTLGLPQVSMVVGKPKKTRAPFPPLSLPSHFLTGTIPVCLCYIVIYHIISRAHSCHHIISPWSYQVGAWKLLVTKVSPQPLKSKRPRGLFFFFFFS